LDLLLLFEAINDVREALVGFPQYHAIHQSIEVDAVNEVPVFFPGV
jgi:hypothetical protein